MAHWSRKIKKCSQKSHRRKLHPPNSYMAIDIACMTSIFSQSTKEFCEMRSALKIGDEYRVLTKSNLFACSYLFDSIVSRPDCMICNVFALVLCLRRLFLFIERNVEFCFFISYLFLTTLNRIFILFSVTALFYIHFFRRWSNSFRAPFFFFYSPLL